MPRLVVELPTEHINYLDTLLERIGLTRTDWVREMIEAMRVVEAELYHLGTRYDREKDAVANFFEMVFELRRAKEDLKKSFRPQNGSNGSKRSMRKSIKI